MKFNPSGPLRGELVPPADKSISHRGALIAAMGKGTTEIINFLDSADTNATLDAIGRLGAKVTVAGGIVTIYGIGLRGEDGPQSEGIWVVEDSNPSKKRTSAAHQKAGNRIEIDVHNAGTLLRLLPGWLSGWNSGSWKLDGDSSIRKRPVDRIIQPLQEMGADIDANDGRYPPLTIKGRQLSGIKYRLPVASAQVKSCLLFAGLLADSPTEIIENLPSRDHTERMLLRAGVEIERTKLSNSNTTDLDRSCESLIRISPAKELHLPRMEIPADISSAAFHIAAATLIPRSRIVIKGVSANWTRIGFIKILQRMGGRVEGELEEEFQIRSEQCRIQTEEPICDLVVTPSELNGVVVDSSEVPLAIDELPLIALLGCFADGETVVRGASELRFKESDRIAALVDGLRSLGAEIESYSDGFAVSGRTELRGGSFDSHGDHRLAMLAAIAGLVSRDGVTVKGIEAAAVSYPSFIEDLSRLLNQ